MEAPREVALATVHQILALGLNNGPRFWATEDMDPADMVYPNPVIVERVFAVPAQRAQFPRVCIIDASGSRREWTTGGVGRYVDHFAFVVYGYVIGNDAITRSQWLERLRYDCFLTLIRASMPRGHIRNFEFTRPEETDQGADEPIGVFAMPGEAVMDDEVEAA
jgi:hypothetical protein